MLSDQPYRYLTVDEMKSLGDDSLPIDVTRDERVDSNRECMGKYIKFSFTVDFGSEVLYLFSSSGLLKIPSFPTTRLLMIALYTLILTSDRIKISFTSSSLAKIL